MKSGQPIISEATNISRIKAMLKNAGWKVLRLNETIGAGEPDIIAMKGGKVIACEVKKSVGWRLPAIQKQRLKEWREQGALACYSTDWRSFEKLLSAIERGLWTKGGGWSDAYRDFQMLGWITGT